MKNKVAIVTGCSSGLGFSLTVKLIQEGYTVYATMRSPKAKNRLEEVCGHSKQLKVVFLDLSNEESVKKAALDILSCEDKIDVLIHNAAAALIGPPDSATTSEMEYLFRVNVISVVQLTQLLLPALKKHGSGHIVLVTSISGVESAAYLGMYSATKFALEAVGLSWATTMHKWNIKVTLIEPGAMNTNLPDSIQIGTFYQGMPDDPYETFNINSHLFLKECLKQGTDPDLVADQIIAILTTSDPKLRHQTCDFSKGLVEKHLQEPQEATWIADHREFIDSFYRKL